MRIWQRIRGRFLGRHDHSYAYAAVVISGAYEEAGDRGRFHVKAGDVLMHDRFEAHLNRLPASGAMVLNLPLPEGRAFEPGLAVLPDPDSVVRLARKNPAAAADLLLSSVAVATARPGDWPDRLAVGLLHDPSICLGEWSDTNGLKPWTLSRGFAQVFGVSPSSFRARARALLAWRAIRTSDESLAQIAARFEFADQSHMTRGVKTVTGLPPRQWRACRKWIQDSSTAMG